MNGIWQSIKMRWKLQFKPSWLMTSAFTISSACFPLRAFTTWTLWGSYKTLIILIIASILKTWSSTTRIFLVMFLNYQLSSYWEKLGYILITELSIWLVELCAGMNTYLSLFKLYRYFTGVWLVFLFCHKKYIFFVFIIYIFDVSC